MSYPTDANFLTSSHDTIPNFGVDPDILSVATGNWSSNSTWDLGRPPQAGEIAGIDSAHTVTLDTTSAVCRSLGIAGKLIYSRSVDTKLLVRDVLVYEGGELDIGTSASPIPSARSCELVFADLALDSGLGQYSNGLLVLGKWRAYGERVVQPFIRVAIEPEAGDSVITLSGTPTGWQAGDLLVFPQSHQWYPGGGTRTERTETAVISSISGATVTLTTTLTYDHPGWRDGDGVLSAYLPHVMNLTRGVIIKSENASGVRGHTMCMEQADADYQNCAFFELGRTKFVSLSNDFTTSGGFTAVTNASPISVDITDSSYTGSRTFRTGDSITISGVTGNTAANGTHTITKTGDFTFTLNGTTGNGTYAGGGTSTHTGTNQIGRYAVHSHHLMGPYPTVGSYQTVCNGNSIYSSLSSHEFRWGIAIHASHYGQYANNAVYNYGGFGIGTEDGSECFNVIDGNAVFKVRGRGERDAGGNEGTGLWFRGPHNYLRNNIAADCYSLNADEASFGFKYFMTFAEQGRKPNFQGADTSVPGEYTNFFPSNIEILECDNNECYACENGMATWWINSYSETVSVSALESTISDFTIWHPSRYGLYSYQVHKTIYDNYRVLADHLMLSNITEQLIGMWWGDYATQQLVVRNANIQGCRVGFIDPYFGGPFNGDPYPVSESLLENSFFRNARDIEIWTIGAPGSGGAGQYRYPKTITVRNCTHGSVAGWSLGGDTHRTMRMFYITHGGFANLILSATVFVEDYNGTLNDDFQLLFTEQAASFIVPQSQTVEGEVRLVGSPVAGLTNQQNWDTYGIAIAGAVAPSDATTRSEIYGLLVITGVPAPNDLGFVGG